MPNKPSQTHKDSLYLLRINRASQPVRVTVHDATNDSRLAFATLNAAIMFIEEKEAQTALNLQEAAKR